jgi:hypothetical protein
MAAAILALNPMLDAHLEAACTMSDVSDGDTEAAPILCVLGVSFGAGMASKGLGGT